MSNLKVGDKIRILEDEHWKADVLKGDILEVENISGVFIYTEDYWIFNPSQEGIGWEKVEEDQ